MPREPQQTPQRQRRLRRNSKSRSQMPVADLCQRALGEMAKRAQHLPTDAAHVEALVLRAVHNRGIFSDYFDEDVHSFVAALAAQATLFHVQPKLSKSFSIAYHQHGIGDQVFIMLSGSGVSAIIRTDEAVTQRFPQPGDSFGLHMSRMRNAAAAASSEAVFTARLPSDLEESPAATSAHNGVQASSGTDLGLDCDIKVTAPADAEAVFLCIPPAVFVPQFALLLRDVVSRSNLQRTLNVLRHAFHGHISDGAATVVASTLSRYMAKWSFCKDKSREEVEMMAYICARDARLVRVAAGETLFRQGDEIDPERAFFVVLRGRAEVWLEHQEEDDETTRSDDNDDDDDDDAFSSLDSSGFRSGASNFNSPDQRKQQDGESSLMLTKSTHPVTVANDGDISSTPTRSKLSATAGSTTTSFTGKPTSAPATASPKPQAVDVDSNLKMCATTLEVGASFGEIALIESGKRTATVVATAPPSTNDDGTGPAPKSFANGDPEPPLSRQQRAGSTGSLHNTDESSSSDQSKAPDPVGEGATGGDTPVVDVKDADEATATTTQRLVQGGGEVSAAGEDGGSDAEDSALYLFAISSAAYAAAIEVAQNEAVQKELAIQRSLSAFRGFSNTQHFEWRHYFRAETVKRNHILFEQGAPSTMVKFIISGTCVARYRDPAAIVKAKAAAAAQAVEVAEEAAALARARAAEEAASKKMSKSRRRRLRRNKRKLNEQQQQGASGANASTAKSPQAAAAAAAAGTTAIAGDWRPIFSFGPGDAVGDIAFCRNITQPFRVQVTSETAVVWTLHDSLLIRERLRAPLENLRLSAMTLEHCFLLSLPPAERLPGQVDFLTTTLTQPYLGRLSACAALFVDECREDRALQTRIVNALHLRKVRRGAVLAVQDQSCQLLAIVVCGTATVHKKVRRDWVAQSPRRSRRPPPQQQQRSARRFFDDPGSGGAETKLERLPRRTRPPVESTIESSAIFLTDVPLESPSLGSRRADEDAVEWVNSPSERDAMASAGNAAAATATAAAAAAATPATTTLSDGGRSALHKEEAIPLEGNQQVDLAEREFKFGDTVRHLDSGDLFGTESLQLLRHKNALPHHSSTVVAESAECWVATIEPSALAEILDDCTNAPQRRKFRFFRNMSALAHLPDHTVRMLADCCEESFWSKGDVVLDCGARNTATLFFIAQGECEVFGRLVSDGGDDDSSRIATTTTGSTAKLQRRSGSRTYSGPKSSDNGAGGGGGGGGGGGNAGAGAGGQNLKHHTSGMMSRRGTGAFAASGTVGSSGFRSRAGSTAAGSSALPAVPSSSEGHGEAGSRALQLHSSGGAKANLIEREVMPSRADPDARIVDTGLLRGAFGVPDLLQQSRQSPTITIGGSSSSSSSSHGVAGAGSSRKKGDAAAAAAAAARVQSVQLQASHFTKQWQKYANVQQGDCFGAAVFFALRKEQQHRIVASGWTDLDAHGRSEKGALSPRKGSSPRRQGSAGASYQNEREPADAQSTPAFSRHPVRLYELRLPPKKSAADQIIKLLRPLRTIAAQRLAWRDQQRERINSLARSMLQQQQQQQGSAHSTHRAASSSAASGSGSTQGSVVARKPAPVSLRTAAGERKKTRRWGNNRVQRPHGRKQQRGHGILVDAVPLRAGNNRGAVITAPWLSDTPAAAAATTTTTAAAVAAATTNATTTAHKRTLSSSSASLLEPGPEARFETTNGQSQVRSKMMKPGGARRVVAAPPGARSLHRLHSPQNRVALRPRRIIGAAAAPTKAVGHDDGDYGVAASDHGTATNTSAEIVEAAARSAQALIGIVPKTQRQRRQPVHSGDGSTNQEGEEGLLPDERDIQRVLALPEIKRSLKQVNWKYRNQW